MKVELTSSEGLKRKIEIKLTPEKVELEMEKAFRVVRGKVELKGFRKGKTPMDVIRSNYGEQIKADVAEDLVKETYPEAIKEQTLKVASPPSVTSLDFTDDGGLNYTVELEVMPEIKKVDYQGLKLTEETSEATDEEVDDYLEHLRKQMAEFRTLDRAATENDIVVVDLKKTQDPKMAIKIDQFPEAEIDLAGPTTVKEFKDQIPGMKAGDEKEIEVSYDSDYPDPNFAGAKITYLCTVKEVKERILPEINDALAKMTGKGETALELKLKLREEITQQKEDVKKRSFRTQIVDQIVKKNQIDVPQAMVEHYLSNVIDDFKKQGQQFEEAKVRESYRPIGENTMRWNLLMHHLAEAEKIEVSPADTEKVIKRFAENYKTTPEQAKEALARSGQIADIAESLLEEKTLDFLIKTAKIVPAPKQK